MTRPVSLPSPTRSARDWAGEAIARLDAVAESSPGLFANALGPLVGADGKETWVRSYALFGANSRGDHAVRLALVTGASQFDAAATRLAVDLVLSLLDEPALLRGVHLCVVPVANVTDRSGRDLSSANWLADEGPELALLRREFLGRGYQGFLRLHGGFATVGPMRARIRGLGEDLLRPAQGCTRSWPVADRLVVDWSESVDVDGVRDGPLSLAPDLPFTPFDLDLRLPRRASLLDTAADLTLASAFLRRFLACYRGLRAHATGL